LTHTVGKVQQKQQQSERVGTQHPVKTPNFRNLHVSLVSVLQLL